MGVSKEIRDALRAHLFGLSGVPDAAHRKLENQAYQPRVGEPWLRESVRFQNEALVAFGGGGLLQLDALALIDLFYPANVGPDAVEAMQDAVVQRFKVGTALVTLPSALRIRVRRVFRSPLVEDPPNWVLGPVTIDFYVHRPNG